MKKILTKENNSTENKMKKKKINDKQEPNKYKQFLKSKKNKNMFFQINDEYSKRYEETRSLR